MSLTSRLAKAKAKLFGTSVRDVPVPFDLPCECGHRVAGLRGRSWKLAVCSGCQAEVFVLPTNVFPAVKTVLSERAAPPSRTAEDEDAGQKPSSESRAPRSPRSAVRASPASEARPSRTPPVKVPAVAGVTEDGTAILQLPDKSISRRIRETLTFTRLLALSIVFLAGATGWWLIQQQRLETARKNWRQEMDLVSPALEKKDLTALRSALEGATKAAKILGRNDAESRRAVSLLNQTEAVLNLSSLDLIQVLSAVFTKSGKIDDVLGRQAAEAIVRQRLLFQTTLRSRSDSDVCELELPLFVREIPVHIEVQSAELKILREQHAELPFVFCAVVESASLTTGAAPRWNIVLDGTQTVVLTNELHAEICGLTKEQVPELEQILARQKALIEGPSMVAPAEPIEPLATPRDSGRQKAE